MLEEWLEKYDITNFGFIPYKICKLNKDYQYLEEIYNNKEKYSNFRNYIREFKLPNKLVDLKNLNLGEVKTIYSLSSVLVHYYIWYDYNLKSEDQYTIPYILSYPFYYSSKILGINPVLTHAGCNLWNWKLKDANLGLNLENLEYKYFLCRDIEETESWFFIIMTYLEYRCGKIIFNMDKIYNELELYENNNIFNENIIFSNLQIISDILDEQIKLINNIYKKCDPKEFYYRLRIFLNGSSKIKNGIILENIKNEQNENINIKYKGASAAQSSIIPLEDIFFNINHNQTNVKDFLNEMLEYMPSKHRNLIKYFKNRPKLSNYFDKIENKEIEKIYNLCILKINKFRKCHICIVKKYIFEQQENENGYGTGGTPLNSFLQTIIENCKIQNINYKPNIFQTIKNYFIKD